MPAADASLSTLSGSDSRLPCPTPTGGLGRGTACFDNTEAMWPVAVAAPHRSVPPTPEPRRAARRPLCGDITLLESRDPVPLGTVAADSILTCGGETFGDESRE